MYKLVQLSQGSYEMQCLSTQGFLSQIVNMCCCLFCYVLIDQKSKRGSEKLLGQLTLVS